MISLFLILAACLSIPAPLQSGIQVSWEPKRVVQGTLVIITAKRNPPPSLTGTLAGEPLHFHPITGGVRAIAAAPLDAGNSVNLDLTSDSGESWRVVIPVKAGSYRTQRLSVASQYGRKPDAATQARIDREAAKARRVSEASHQTPRMWTLPFIKPAAGRITSPFGTARVFNGEVKSRHTGLDYGGGTGAPVKAANDGVVALVDSFYLGGNCIYLDHGAGMVTAYLHLSKWYVKPGQTVKKGQLIGRIGATGRVTGPHLHWIARYGKISVNPQSLLTLRGL